MGTEANGRPLWPPARDTESQILPFRATSSAVELNSRDICTDIPLRTYLRTIRFHYTLSRFALSISSSMSLITDGSRFSIVIFFGSSSLRSDVNDKYLSIGKNQLQSSIFQNE